MNVGSLFAGIGGFDLAAQWLGWETKWYSEIDPYACRVMQKHFPRAYNVGDITTWEPRRDHSTRYEPIGDEVDLICGGFPCQPVSVAGKQLAQDDPRWLWPHFARIIRILRPRYVVAENVPGLLVRGMGDVLGDLSEIGYDAEWETISAAAVGAPHRRDRVWIVAYPNGDGLQRLGNRRDAGDQARYDTRRQVAGTSGPNVADAMRAGQEYVGQGDTGSERLTGRDTPARGGWWDVEPDVGRVAHGVRNRVDRLKCLGNSIVPQVAYYIFQQIQAWEEARGIT